MSSASTPARPGRIENSQVGVFLCYGSDKGAALVDRELYIPQEWAADQERRRAAGIPDTVEFATKPELARRMIGRALDSGAAAAWVAADEVYGHDSKLRRFLGKPADGLCASRGL